MGLCCYIDVMHYNKGRTYPGYTLYIPNAKKNVCRKV